MLRIILIILAVILVLLVVIFAVSAYECKRFRVTEYRIVSEKLPQSFDGYRFLMLADLHNTCFGNDNDKLLSEIDRLAPEEILIAGDMITYGEHEGKKNHVAISFLNTLARKYRILYGLGNHEMRMKREENEVNSYRRFTKELDGRIRILDDETVELARGGDVLRIAGLTLDSSYFTRFHRRELTAAAIEEKLAPSKADNYQILIAHSPEYLDAYADWGADLVLSGHVHGGIIRLPLVGGVISPRLTLFPKYDYGRFRKGNTTMLVTGGLGTHFLRLRFLNVPELCVITLLKK